METIETNNKGSYLDVILYESAEEHSPRLIGRLYRTSRKGKEIFLYLHLSTTHIPHYHREKRFYIPLGEYFSMPKDFELFFPLGENRYALMSIVE